MIRYWMHSVAGISNALPLQNPFDKTEDAKIKKRAPVTRDTTSKFNRDTVWLATGVLGTVVFAALVLAFQERQPQVRQAESDILPNIPATVASEVANSSKANGKMTPRQGDGVDHAEISPQEISSSQTETAANSVLADMPQINRHAHRSARARGSKTPNGRNRSSVVFGSAYVKRRLIELWHQSLARSETRSWTAFSKLNRRVSKKAAYTAETNH